MPMVVNKKILLTLVEAALMTLLAKITMEMVTVTKVEIMETKVVTVKMVMEKEVLKMKKAAMVLTILLQGSLMLVTM